MNNSTNNTKNSIRMIPVSNNSAIVYDENRLMFDMMSENDEQIKSLRKESMSKSQIVNRENISSTMGSFLESKISDFNENKMLSSYSNQKKDSENDFIRSSVKTKSEISFNSILSDRNFIDEVNQKSKIENLNNNILKLNEIVEQNLRKINSIEKENQFLRKKLSESETLNNKLMNEQNLKNQFFNDLTRKNLELSYRYYNISKIITNNYYPILYNDDYLIKLISNRILSEFSKNNNTNKIHDCLDNFVKNTEIRILLSNSDGKNTPKSSMKTCLSKSGKAINKVTFKETNMNSFNIKFDELNFTNDVDLKNLIIQKVLYYCKSDKIKYNSSKVLPSLQLRRKISISKIKDTDNN